MVSCDWLKSCNVTGYHFTVKSPSFSADHIEQRIESFISRFALYLRQISKKSYDKTCASCRPREYWDYEAHVVEWGNQVRKETWMEQRQMPFNHCCIFIARCQS